jgi:hypothetical protein
MACILCQGSIRAGFLGALGLALVGLTRISGQNPPEPKVGSPRAEAELPPVSKRGPGMKGPATDFLKLPVPRTFDLTHVEPEHFAAALGKDPQRIFEFVRDHVAFEVYTGCLRGPRGTLLAMAGNSVDRAGLLAALLEKSGQRVRFARGTLPTAVARDLVASIWTERPQAALAKSETSPALKAASDTFVAGVKRDYSLLRDHLKKMDPRAPRPPTVTMAVLIKEAQSHFWVQWLKDNKWVDLDPSFADAVLGETFAKSEETLPVMPENLFHRVNIRIQLEEYAILSQGNAEKMPTSREILTYQVKAADISNFNLVLTHQPENWTGPANNLERALATTIKDTGQIKPVLLVGPEKWIAGKSFRQKLPTDKGIGGVGTLLGGQGRRNPLPIATAESIEFEFIYPDGRKEKVVREILDVIGLARRAKGKNLSSEEVRNPPQLGAALKEATFSLFFNTGTIDRANFLDLSNDPTQSKETLRNLVTPLQRINITFAVLSDSLLHRLARPAGTALRFYPDSPRLQIVEFFKEADKVRITLDLRRNQTRGVALGPQEDIFLARVFRGVVEGTLERILLEYITSCDRKNFGPVVSTSSLFEKAQSEGILTGILDPRELQTLPLEIGARLRREFAAGFLVLAPKQLVLVNEKPHFAWWRIDPHSGDVTGVGEDGLHVTHLEYKLVRSGQLVYVLCLGSVVDVALYGTAYYVAMMTRLDMYANMGWGPW